MTMAEQGQSTCIVFFWRIRPSIQLWCLTSKIRMMHYRSPEMNRAYPELIEAYRG